MISRVRHCRALVRIAMSLLLPVLVAGCLQMERTVRVNGDGSGVLIERMVLSNDIVEMMAGMQPEGEPFNIRDDEKLRGNAANFGTSVRFLSATDLVTDFGRGYEARYAFDDINALRVGQDLEDSMPGDPAAGDGSQEKEPKFTTFTLRRTNPARLVVHWAVDEGGSDPGPGESAAEYPETASTPEQEQMAMEMMKMAFKDMRVAMHVEVVGEIVETNAMHLEGTRVTLMDIDFGEMLSNESALRAMAGKKPESVVDMKELMKLVPGLKLEIEPEIAILFR
jgi:hypothetical protein